MRDYRFPLMMVFLWINILLFGGLVFETAVFYPDHFYDVPHSLAVSTEFMAVTGPGTFLRPAGMATVAVDVVTLIVMWRNKATRGWIATSLVILVLANFVFSVLYFWPANTVMFTEGLAKHSPRELREVANGFVAWNFVRIAGDTVAMASAFVGFLRYYGQVVVGRRGALAEPVR